LRNYPPKCVELKFVHRVAHIVDQNLDENFWNNDGKGYDVENAKMCNELSKLIPYGTLEELTGGDDGLLHVLQAARQHDISIRSTRRDELLHRRIDEYVIKRDTEFHAKRRIVQGNDEDTDDRPAPKRICC